MNTQFHTIEDPLPRETLRERLDASALLAGEVREQSLKWLNAQASELGRSCAVEALSAEGWLTAFQAEAVFDGRLSSLQIGNYDVLDRLGSGGMGTVYKARHRRMKRIVAIKVLALSLSENKTFVQRFQREVETAARLTHPNIVTAHDADVCDAGHYLVMEFVAGTDLDRLVRTRGPLSPKLAATMILQAARGLDYAHSQGVIHRDVKPANLLIDGSGTLKITDLGLARCTDLLSEAASDECSLTKHGGILGTVDFMSPEQAFNPSRVDHRADIYSLGCTLFYLVMGRPPYGGETPMETLLLHKQDQIPSLLNLHADMPYELDDLYKRMLAKRPAERFDSMAQVVRGLERSGLALSEPDLQTELQRMLSPDPSSSPPESALPSARDAGASAVSHRTRGSLKVLISDGSLTARVHVRNTLTSLGFTQLTDVSDGALAVEALAAQQFDLVVTGLNLSRIDGQELIEHIRRSPSSCNTPILLVTTESALAKLQTLRRAGVSAIIDKSFRINEVRAVLDPLFPIPP
ncbi:MAG: serine/threonine-protein kinase [Planctomycetaceae bacterium]